MSQSVPSLVSEVFQSAQIPLTLSDPSLPDEPLVLANEAFFDMTGFSESEAFGQNCRFMQGKDTLQSSRNSIRGDFAAKRDTKLLIRNYRKSGEEFDNFLYIFTLFDNHDAPIFRIGSQFEVPEANRAKAFEAHVACLCDQLEALNEGGAFARSQLIDIGELAGITVKELLKGRLDNLRSN